MTNPYVKQPATVYTAMRVIISVVIGMPANPLDRLDFLADQLNQFLSYAKECSSSKLRVMKYSYNGPATYSRRKEWLKSFKGRGSNHVVDFTHGFFPWQKLRDGTFRLRINLAVPLRRHQSKEDFISAVNNGWGEPSDTTIRYLDGQNISEPRNMGWLMRSPKFACNTSDLKDELERRAANYDPPLFFSLSYKTVPDPNGGVYNPDTAVKAICIETNNSTYDAAWEFLQRTYNTSQRTPPLGIYMNFIGSKDHPDYKDNPTVLYNMSKLMKRQKYFTDSLVIARCSKLFQVDTPLVGTRTLRHMLMDLKPITLGSKF